MGMYHIYNNFRFRIAGGSIMVDLSELNVAFGWLFLSAAGGLAVAVWLMFLFEMFLFGEDE